MLFYLKENNIHNIKEVALISLNLFGGYFCHSTRVKCITELPMRLGAHLYSSSSVC
jgi:hypothetical protein